MVDDRLNPARVKYTVFTSGDQIVHRHRRCNLVTENGVEAQHVNIIGWIVDTVGIEDLFSNCFTHVIPQKLVFVLMMIYTMNGLCSSSI